MNNKFGRENSSKVYSIIFIVDSKKKNITPLKMKQSVSSLHSQLRIKND